MARAVLILPVVGLIAGPLHALQLRSYLPAVHDRFTGFPAAPVMNPGFLHGSARFTGVGWYVADTRRQFTLVTSQHFLCATHFTPVVGGIVRFVDSTGAVIERSVVSVTPVPNDSAGSSDIAVGKLDAPLPSTVAFYPWLNLAEEEAALGARLMVFGRIARGGSGVLDGFETVDETGIADTRCLRFDYRNAVGGANDCKFEGGDSGSPCFVTVNGMPVLVGTNSAVGTGEGFVANFSAYVPHYAARIDAILATDGMAMTPVFSSAAGLVTRLETSPPTLRQLHPGTAGFFIRNPGTQPAGMVAAVVEFGSGAVPDRFSAPGWAVTGGAGIWTLQRMSLGAGEEVGFSAEWDVIPETDTLPCVIALTSDASPDALLRLDLAVAPSYAAWCKDLPEAGTEDDPDEDGIPNLIEYAFGSDPLSGSPGVVGGLPPNPTLSTAFGSAPSVSLIFPERIDAAERGLSYVVEFSETLLDGSWTTDPPEGLESTAEELAPGFLKRTLTWASDSPLRFARLRVEMAE